MKFVKYFNIYLTYFMKLLIFIIQLLETFKVGLHG